MLVKFLSHPAGRGLSLSLHAAYHRYVCLAEDVPPEELAAYFAHGDFDAACVEASHTREAAALCTRLDPTAARSGAADTVLREKDGTVGYDTGYAAFLSATHRAGLPLHGSHALLLGEDSPAPAARIALRDAGAASVLSLPSAASVTPKLPGLSEVTLLVSTLPPEEAAAIDLSLFPALGAVFDTVSLPFRTPLRQAAEALGIASFGGVGLLAAQTEVASALLTGRRPDPALIPAQCRRAAEENCNIVLTGMPGCGKRTVGKKIAELLGKEFISVEDQLTEELGVFPAAYAAQHGDDALREAETRLLWRIGAERGLVIATRGETALFPKNRLPLRQNGLIFLLLRAPGSADDPDAGRLWRERLPQYAAFCDASVENNTTVRDCAHLIAEEALRNCETLL